MVLSQHMSKFTESEPSNGELYEIPRTIDWNHLRPARVVNDFVGPAGGCEKWAFWTKKKTYFRSAMKQNGEVHEIRRCPLDMSGQQLWELGSVKNGRGGAFSAQKA